MTNTKRTTITIIIANWGVMMFVPYIVGGTEMCNHYDGYVECSGDGNVRTFNFTRSSEVRISRQGANALVDVMLHDGNEVSELVLDTDQYNLEDLEWQDVDGEHWKIKSV